MEMDVQGQGNVVGAVERGEPVAGAGHSAAIDAGVMSLPLIEISDKDYRSFCWPCYDLEENGDCKPD